MCRWIAYRGERIPLENYVTEPEHSLISQSLNALEATASVNGDGFGLGWYGDYAEPGLYHQVRPAWSDQNLHHLCRHIRSQLFFAHVRATTATPVALANCHPFAQGGWMFMHNGFVGGWNRLRRRVEELIPDALYPSRLGTTDSEAMFLAILGAGAADDPVLAAREIMLRLEEMLDDSPSENRLRFTAALTDGEAVYAFRYAVNDSANTLYYRSNGKDTVIASEPLDADRGLWKPVPENHVLIAEPNSPPAILPFIPC